METVQETMLDDIAIDRILEQYNTYLLRLACKGLPQGLSHPDTLDLDIDELVQNVRIKLWQALKRRHITHIGAYIRCIVRTETVNLLRRHTAISSLPMTEDGELYQGNVLMSNSEGMGDPVYEVEQEETIEEYVTCTVNELIHFPQIQRRAMICHLKDKLDDVLLLVDTFCRHDISIEQEHWPTRKNELQSYRSSIVIAKSKLRASLSMSE